MRSSSDAARFERDTTETAGPRRFVADALCGARFEPDAGAPPPDPAQLEAAAFAAGREAGRGELPWTEAEALKTATRAVDEAARRLDALYREGLQAQREAVIALAIAIAEQILGRECTANPVGLGARIEAALAELPAGVPARIRLAPADHATLAAGEAGEGDALATAGLEADPTLAPGDVVVQAGASRVDGRIATLLERVRMALEPALGAEASTADVPDAPDPVTADPEEAQ